MMAILSPWFMSRSLLKIFHALLCRFLWIKMRVFLGSEDEIWDIQFPPWLCTVWCMVVACASAWRYNCSESWTDCEEILSVLMMINNSSSLRRWGRGSIYRPSNIMNTNSRRDLHLRKMYCILLSAICFSILSTYMIMNIIPSTNVPFIERSDMDDHLRLQLVLSRQMHQYHWRNNK